MYCQKQKSTIISVIPNGTHRWRSIRLTSGEEVRQYGGLGGEGAKAVIKQAILAPWGWEVRGDLE